MILHSSNQGDMSVVLTTENSDDFFEIPTGKEFVYNDNMYEFTLSGTTDVPLKVFINDEAYDIQLCGISSDSITFKLKQCEKDKPFLHCFGAVKIEIEMTDVSYYSTSIAVMVSNTNINNSVLNMVQFIYDNCEEYLYEEHKHSLKSVGIQDNEIKSLEAKIAFLQRAVDVYKQSYQYMKTNPYGKLEKTERVDSFNKLQSISPNTIRHIVNHIDELTAVNYDTGIRFNNQYYQPNRVLVECNSYSYDVYENRMIIGFLKTIVVDISGDIHMLQERTYFPKKTTVSSDYIDSMYQIFSRSLKRIADIIEKLKTLQAQYTELYFFYSRLIGITADPIRTLPIFSSVFRSINAYRQIYQIISEWFSIGNYDLGKDDLILSFISTSKIYEYYCLIKMLKHISQNMNMELIESKHMLYGVRNRYFSDTKYNNTFVFTKQETKLTLFFQPVIFGNDSTINGISLFRNTSTNAQQDVRKKGGFIYTPDYLIKIETNGVANYIILDAKFSTTENIRIHQLQELVYKYLFSISPLNENESISGLYILCGKTSGDDKEDIVHDLAQKIHHIVKPFADILVVGGNKTDDYSMLDILFNSIT